MLGHKLVQRWRSEFDVWTTLRNDFARYDRFGIFERGKTIDSLSVLDTAALEAAVERVKPDVIFNATWGTVIFRELPREWLFTDRLKRHWRGKDDARKERAET